MQKILQENNLNIKIPLKLPFLYVYGRSTGEVKVCGDFIYPENVKEAIYKDKEISNKLTGVFKMYIKEERKKYIFCIDAELIRGIRNSNALQKKIVCLLEESLSKVNVEYGKTRKISPTETKIHLRLFDYGSFIHKSGIKIRYS